MLLPFRNVYNMSLNVTLLNTELLSKAKLEY